MSQMFLRTPRSHASLAVDLGIALLPAAIWAVFLYGGRAAVLILLCGFCCMFLEIPVRILLQHCAWQHAISPFAFLTGVLTAFWFPPTVPLWIPMFAAVPAVLCRTWYGYFGHRLFNASILSAFLLRVLFPQYLCRFTQPFAYFPVFPATPDEALVNAYRVTSPLNLLKRDTFYEDGMLAQLYGFAPGAIGAVAVACLLLGGIWLLVRRQLSLWSVGGFALILWSLAMATAPEEMEMTTYAWLYLLAGGIPLAGFFALSDPASAPRGHLGQFLFGLLAGGLTVLFRTLSGPTGEGVLAAILVANLLTPLLERLSFRQTRPRPTEAQEDHPA